MLVTLLIVESNRSETFHALGDMNQASLPNKLGREGGSQAGNTECSSRRTTDYFYIIVYSFLLLWEASWLGKGLLRGIRSWISGSRWHWRVGGIIHVLVFGAHHYDPLYWQTRRGLSWEGKWGSPKLPAQTRGDGCRRYEQDWTDEKHSNKASPILVACWYVSTRDVYELGLRISVSDSRYTRGPGNTVVSNKSVLPLHNNLKKAQPNQVRNGKALYLKDSRFEAERSTLRLSRSRRSMSLSLGVAFLVSY